MANMSRGLFDPRKKMVHWPEPNDDPNIPYTWGLSGYVGNSSPSGVSVTSQPLPKNAPKPKVQDNTSFRMLGGALITLSALGLFHMYSNIREGR